MHAILPTASSCFRSGSALINDVVSHHRVVVVCCNQPAEAVGGLQSAVTIAHTLSTNHRSFCVPPLPSLHFVPALSLSGFCRSVCSLRFVLKLQLGCLYLYLNWRWSRTQGWKERNVILIHRWDKKLLSQRETAVSGRPVPRLNRSLCFSTVLVLYNACLVLPHASTSKQSNVTYCPL